LQSLSGHLGESSQNQSNLYSSSAKWRILSAAEEIMSEKGLMASSISEIAAKAGVTDSVIYQYFKGKQDLLFSIPAERMKEVLTLLEEQLTGIQDVESRLSKMVWFHLRYNDTHRGYARLLLLECRSSIAFYSTPAYALIRKYSGILSLIIAQGVREGKFRSDVEVYVIRDLVLGTLDMESIGCLASEEVKASESDFEAIMALIHSMIAIKDSPEDAKTNRENEILNAAEKIFAEKDFHKATISEIAKSSGVADSTIYEYFENKEDILFSLAVRRINTYLSAADDAFEIKNPVRKLRRLIKYHFSSFLREPRFLRIFLLQLQLNQRFYGSKAFDRFRNYFELIEKIIEEGKASGVFHSSVSPRVFRNMFLGAFSHMALRWILLQGAGDVNRMEEINQATDLLEAAAKGHMSQET